MQFHCIKWDIQLNQEIEYMWKDMDSCLLIEVWVINIERSFWSATDAINTASKRAIQKTAEAAGDLIGNKIADKITSASKKKSNNNNDDVELTTPKKRYISPEERQQKKDNYW